MKNLFIPVEREGYTPSQVDSPISVGELIDELRSYDSDAKVILSFDGGYTYGTIKIDCIYD